MSEKLDGAVLTTSDSAEAKRARVDAYMCALINAERAAELGFNEIADMAIHAINAVDCEIAKQCKDKGDAK